MDAVLRPVCRCVHQTCVKCGQMLSVFGNIPASLHDLQTLGPNALLNDEVINFFFKSKDAAKETLSLVFVVTPTSYNPGSVSENCATSKTLRNSLSVKPDHDSIEPTLPGPAHEADLDRTLKDLRPGQRDYRPTVEDLKVDLEGCCEGRAKSGVRHGRLKFRRKR